MREIRYINNEWYYYPEFDEAQLTNTYDFKDFEKVELPHTNIELPYNYFNEANYQFVSCYMRKIQYDESMNNKLIFIDFEGVMIACDVYLNGKHLINHRGGYTPFSVDLTNELKKQEENILVVVVDSTERKDIPPYGNVVDYLTYGGIYREVSLRLVEKTHIHQIYAQPHHCLTPSKSLSIEVELSSLKEITGQLSVSLYDGEVVLAKKTSVTNIESGLSLITLTLDHLETIELWDLDHPKRYKVCTTLTVNEMILDHYEDFVGFREAIFKPEGFFLNGKLVKLIGLNRHQSYPYVGYAMPERVQKKDADILKFDLGLNIVRTSHYLQSRHFLDRCDEIGLLVFEEIPGWQHVGDLAWQDLACRDVEVMIKRDYNRPAIILWGVRINESQDEHDFYTRTNALARSLDSTRQTGGVRYVQRSEFLEDVFTLNDFVHKGGERVLITQKEATGLDYKVPYLVTESNGHMYPTKTFDQEAKAVEHAMRHFKVVNHTLGSDEHTGSISWCAFDYNTHSSFGSGDKICHHGVMDMFRNKKYAGFAYASQKDPRQEIILQPITVGSRGERDGGGVVPFTILTNCDYIEIFKDEQRIDQYYPDFETFPHLPHPPITVYHLLPENLPLPISDQDKSAIKNFVVNKIKTGNLVDLTPEDYQFYGEIAARAQVDIRLILGIVFKLAGGWGEKTNQLVVKGYYNGEVVMSKTISEEKWAERLVAIPDDFELSLAQSSYDATRIEVKLLDNLGEAIRFANDFVEVAIEGPGKILGPSKFGMTGGMSAFWIRTTGKSGIITLTINSMYLQTEVEIEVK